MSENRKLTGKVAIVFGGSRGIGAAAARRLAREGANVGLTYVSAPDKALDTVRAIEEEGRTGLAIKADSADPTAIRDAVIQAVAQFGRLDIVVVAIGSTGLDRVDRPRPALEHDCFKLKQSCSKHTLFESVIHAFRLSASSDHALKGDPEDSVARGWFVPPATACLQAHGEVMDRRRRLDCARRHLDADRGSMFAAD
jgi:NAD(P)-dependent dehydrogenase (short-subunit alcohol dehydrogenase family)